MFWSLNFSLNFACQEPSHLAPCFPFLQIQQLFSFKNVNKHVCCEMMTTFKLINTSVMSPVCMLLVFFFFFAGENTSNTLSQQSTIYSITVSPCCTQISTIPSSCRTEFLYHLNNIPHLPHSKFLTITILSYFVIRTLVVSTYN